MSFQLKKMAAQVKIEFNISNLISDVFLGERKKNKNAASFNLARQPNEESLLLVDS